MDGIVAGLAPRAGRSGAARGLCGIAGVELDLNAEVEVFERDPGPAQCAATRLHRYITCVRGHNAFESVVHEIFETIGLPSERGRFQVRGDRPGDARVTAPGGRTIG